MATVKDVILINLPIFLDTRGNLSFAEQNKHIPFEIKRTYWIYDVPGGEERGGHAFKKNQEFIVALSGSFEVVVDDGGQKKSFLLNHSYYGLYVPAGLWREIVNFSTNSLALEFGSIHYSEEDYIRNYDEYLRYRQESITDNLPPISDNQPSDKNPPITDKYTVFDCTLVELDRHHNDKKGNLSVVENGQTFPFDVKRVYYLYNVPKGKNRGSHAHKELSQLIVAASGSFTMTLDDGNCKRSFFLNRPYQGIYVKPGMWRDLENFSSGAVCMVLASDVYKEDDYLRDYQRFLDYRKNG